MIPSNLQLLEALKIIEDAEAQNKARIATSKASLGVQKSQKKADIARLDQLASNLSEVRQEFDEGASSPILLELVKELRLIRQASVDTNKLLQAILKSLS